MIQGTTPTFKCKVVGSVDLQKAENVYVTITQGNTEITMTGDELTVTENTISCFLTQKKSLLLQAGQGAKIQVNWTYEDTSGEMRRAATRVKEIPIGEQLLRRVIE